ncbi:MAG: hypothetical protein WBA29_09195 [Xanthobacteraceae bacterium]
MRSLLALVLATSAIFSLSTTVAAAQDEAPQAVTCSGPFAKDSSRAKLVAAFGAANVTDQQIDGAEGSSEPATVVFAKDRARRIEVTWSDDKAKARPAGVTIRSPSNWTGPEGIRAGMALPDVANRNGQPLKVNGFEWDYGGYAVNLKGKLASLPGGCGVMLRFSPGVDISGKRFRPIVGEKQIRSDNAVLLSAKPVLAEWRLVYDE